MNFDDKYTKESEETFQKYLKEVRSIPPEAFKEIKKSQLVILEFLEKLKNKPDKSQEDFDLIAQLHEGLKELLQKMEDIKLILDISLYRQSLAFYENVKKLAKEGDKEAERIYNELKIHIEKFDAN